MTTTTTNNHDLINILALSATAGTLKKVYCASGNDTIRKLRMGLQTDMRELTRLDDCNTRVSHLELTNDGDYITVIDDNDAHQAINSMVNDYCVSDAYDLYMIAYEYLWDMMINQNYACNDTITITLKNGDTKERTIYQCACMAIRKEIYANKSIENNGKYIYIEDMSGDDESGNNALDRHYIRCGKYYDMGGECKSGDITSSLDGIYTGDNDSMSKYNDIIASLNLTDRQATILHYRMQGMSLKAIAEKLNVQPQTLNKTLDRMRDKVSELYPELVRNFDLAKHSR